MTHRTSRDVGMTRRTVLKGTTAISLAAAGSISISSAQQGPTILGRSKLTITGYYRGPAFLVASHKGHFSEQRLDVEFHLVRLAPEHNRGLAEGRWPITLSSADTMLARTTQDGIDFVIFMQAEEGLDVQLVVRPEIKTFSELRGKLFAADPVDSNYDLVRNKIMRDNGVPESEYRIEILGNSSVRAAAFDERKVDAAMLQPPFSESSVAKGGVILAQGSQYVSNWPIVCGWGLRSWIETNRSTVVRFVRAMASAADWAIDPQNREETIRLLMQEEKLSRERAERNYGYLVRSCMLNPVSIRRNLEYRIELGYYKPPHKSTEMFYDATYWSEATGSTAPPPAGRPRNAKPT